jgi:hypothetical protein
MPKRVVFQSEDRRQVVELDTDMANWLKIDGVAYIPVLTHETEVRGWGDLMSDRVAHVTKKRPCKGCRKVRDAVNKVLS